jgi:hypothetical protein
LLKFQSKLFQDDIKSIDDAADAKEQNPQDQVDPEILPDLSFVKINGQRRDEKSDDDLNNFIVHAILL